MTALDTTGLMSAVVSSLVRLGVFGTVNDHESLVPPGAKDLMASVWVESISTIRSSGLPIGSGRIDFTVRIQQAQARRPAKPINDTRLLSAVDAVMRAFSADFELTGPNGPRLRQVDVLGAYGEPLSARAGYLVIDNVQCRTYELLLPLSIIEIWALSP
jgi:hypothetical protein